MTVRQSLSSAVVLVATSMNDSGESRNDKAHSRCSFLPKFGMDRIGI